jgi:hypothetical protein
MDAHYFVILKPMENFNTAPSTIMNILFDGWYRNNPPWRKLKKEIPMPIISGFEGKTEGQVIRALGFWTVDELNSSLRECEHFFKFRKSGADFEYAKFLKFCILRVLENRKGVDEGRAVG